MKKSRFIIVTLIAAVLVSAVGIASAQGFGQAARGDRMRGIGMLGLGRQVMEAADLTVQEMHDKLAAGMTFEQVLTEAGVDVDTFKAELIADVTARMNTAVENGRITQEQADTWLTTLTENLDTALTQTHDMAAMHPFMGRGHMGKGTMGMGRGMRGMHGRGMGQGFGWMNPQTPDITPTPETSGSL